MGERVKAATAGNDYSVLPAVEYDYDSATGITLSNNTSTPTASPLTGLYRMVADVDMYVTCGANPTASRTEFTSFLLAAGVPVHELLDAKKVAAITKTDGVYGRLRLHPVKTV